MADQISHEDYVAGLEQALVAFSDVYTKMYDSLMGQIVVDPANDAPGSAYAAFKDIPMFQGTKLNILIKRLGAQHKQLPSDKAYLALEELLRRLLKRQEELEAAPAPRP